MTYQYLTRFLWVKSVSDIIFVTKIVKRLGLYGYCFQKLGAYRRDFDETKWVSSLIKN